MSCGAAVEGTGQDNRFRSEALGAEDFTEISYGDKKISTQPQRLDYDGQSWQ